MKLTEKFDITIDANKKECGKECKYKYFLGFSIDFMGFSTDPCCTLFHRRLELDTTDKRCKECIDIFGG